MPHVKVAPFDTQSLLSLPQKSQSVTFVAKGLKGEDWLLGVDFEEEHFLLQVKPEPQSVLVKYDKVTRPLKVNLLKEALREVVNTLDTEILSENITLSKTKVAMGAEYLKKIEDFEEITFSHQRICVEVGFGSGRHILYQAQKYPDTLFIGLEIHTPSAQQLLKQIALQGLDNIWVVNYDARLFLEMLPSNACSQIFVHFPVPWDKKPQRRVISPSFLEESMRVLERGGRLELRTDSDNYFWYALETFFATPKSDVQIRKNASLEVISKYEARWRRQEKDIYDVYVTAQEESPQRHLSPSFDFGTLHYVEGLEEHISTQSWVEEQFFVHFERVYLLQTEKGMLIKCAFGSFDRPEHKYLYLDATKACYFGSTPVKTQVNALAHLKMIQLLQEGVENV